MQAPKYVQVRTCSRRAGQRLRIALEKIAAPLTGRQFQWLRNIRENSPQAWSDLCQLGRIFSHPPAEIVQTRRLSQIAFNDLDEGDQGKRFISFVAVADGASEANAARVLRHFHRQARLANARSAPEHDDRPVAAQRAIHPSPHPATPPPPPPP